MIFIMGPTMISCKATSSDTNISVEQHIEGLWLSVLLAGSAYPIGASLLKYLQIHLKKIIVLF